MELLPHYKLHQVEVERHVATFASTKKEDRIKRRRLTASNMGALGIPNMAALAQFQVAHNSRGHLRVSQGEESPPKKLPPPFIDADDQDMEGSSVSSSSHSVTSITRSIKVEKSFPGPGGSGPCGSVDLAFGGEEGNSQQRGVMADEYSCESTYAREEGVPGVDYLWLK